MPSPHPLTSLYRARPADACRELRALLNAHRGNVTHTARALGLSERSGPTTLQAWITAWGLRAWLTRAWPPGQRIAEATPRREPAPRRRGGTILAAGELNGRVGSEKST